MAKKTLVVSSVTYNLAGDDPPVGYLKTVVAGGVLFETNASIGDIITNSLLNGPGMRMRKFAKWAVNSGYTDVVGVAQSRFIDVTAVDQAVLGSMIPHAENQTVVFTFAEIGMGDYGYWVDAYMATVHPTEVNDDFTTDIDADGLITITMDVSGAVYTTLATGFDTDAQYLYMQYHLVTDGVAGPQQYVQYKAGSGNSEYDTLFSEPRDWGTFFPFIPLRVDNRMISPTYLPEVYDMAKKAVAKAIDGGKIDKIIANIEDNDSIGDIDYGYIVFGVSLNTRDNSSKKYIYTLFNEMLAFNGSQGSSVNVRSNKNGVVFNMTMRWSGITKTVGTGQFAPDKLKGEYAILNEGGVVVLYEQTAADSFTRIAVPGLSHSNLVYKSKGVFTSGIDALNDAEVSGFIVPLQEEIFRAMGLVDASQMANATAYMVFNCYEEVKEKWYQTDAFKIVLVIIIIVVTIFTAGAGSGTAGAGGGVLGSAAAVGAALGFAGTMAIIVGTLANALASMLIMKILQAGATALFGEEFGAIIGTIAGIIAIAYGTAYSNGQSMGSVMTEFTKAENLLKLTEAAGKGYADYLNNQAASIQQRTQDMLSQYNESSKEIKTLTELNLGYGAGMINPLNFTDVLAQAGESRDSFLSRTLLTGTDIARMSLDMVYNFTGTSLSTELS